MPTAKVAHVYVRTAVIDLLLSTCMHGCSYLWLGSFLLDMEGTEGKEKLLGGSIPWQSSKIKTFFLQICTFKAGV